MRRFVTFLAVLVWCGAGVTRAAELDLSPLQRDLQFNFGNPGARALGMGGAFLGRADDASAAEANPAGLTVISKRELTAEFRNGKVTTPFPSGATLRPTAENPSPPLLPVDIESSSSGVSFASFAMPVGPVVLAAYYQEPLNYTNTQSLNQPTIQEFTPGVPNANVLVDVPGDFSLQYKSKVIGLAAGWKLGQWSIGAAAKRQSIDLQSDSNTFGFAGGVPLTSSPRMTASLRGSQSKMAFSGGLLWSSATENLTFGGVYKKGTEFDDVTISRTVCVPATAPARGNATALLAQPSTCLQPATYRSPFQVPDRYGVGMSIRWRNGITLNEDVVRVKYSQLLPGLRSGIFCELFTAAGYGGVNGQANPFCINPVSGFEIKDVTEVHIGAEWVLPRTPVAIRLGAWIDPAHRPTFDPERVGQLSDVGQFVCVSPQASGNPVAGCEPAETVFANARNVAAVYFGSAAGQTTHYAFGIGYLARSFELNAGYDHSRTAKTVSFQALARF